MKYISLIIVVFTLSGCVQSSVGGGTKWKNGQETDKFNLCMGHCLSKTADGLQCTAFSRDMADICKDYLAE